MQRLAADRTMQRLAADRVLSALRRGSSCPVVVDTARGRFVVKLRGAAQGVGALIAELIVAELAQSLGLQVPERVLIDLPRDCHSEVRRDELLELLGRSVGLNVGLRWLPGARDLVMAQRSQVADAFAAATLWLDGLVMNPDRTSMNPNVLFYQKRLWVIDHGASLPFQYGWDAVTEDAPRESPFCSDHVFAERRAALQRADARLAEIITRETLERAVSVVPDEMLMHMAIEPSPARTRAAYVAFLRKRLRAPRPFL